MNLVKRFIRNPNKAYKLLSIKLLSTFGDWDFRRFIVLTTGRTGSNMLISFLNSHPNVYAVGEIFRDLNGRNYKDAFAKVYAKQPYFIKAKGFKIFYTHPHDDETNDFWDYLRNFDNLWVIHLKRRNIFRRLISSKIAVKQDIWLSYSPKDSDTSKGKTITFTAEELEKDFKQTRREEIRGDKMFRNHPLISVYYEDLVNNRESTFGEITDFLGVPYVRPKTNLRKQNPEGLRDLVTNYNELKLAFWGTEYQVFFEE